jgi:hypothetical protein
MLRADDLARVTWCCLHYATVADVTPQLRAALERAGIAAFDLNGRCTPATICSAASPRPCSSPTISA